MGYKLNVDLETSSGPSYEVYTRIESMVVNRTTSKLRLQLTYWIDKEHAIKTNRVYVDDELIAKVGMIQDKVLYYENDETEGKEIILPTLIEEDIAEEVEVDTPIFEKQEVIRKVPYISFNEAGEEISLEREVKSEKEVQIGTEREVRRVIDLKLVDNIYEYSYKVIKNNLGKLIPKDKIEKE